MRTAVVRLAVIAVSIAPLVAADLVSPAEVGDLIVSRSGIDVDISWSPVTLDVQGGPENVERYRVYRSNVADFSNHYFADDTVGTALSDPAAADDAQSYFYQVVAVDAAKNESPLEASGFAVGPVLTGETTALTVELDWTDALPVEDVAHYEVHYGVGSRDYDTIVNVGTSLSYSLPADANTGYFAKIVAVDADGNHSAFSNEYSAALNGTLDVVAQQAARLCPDYGNCEVKDGEIPRSGGQEIIVPVDLPEGDWVNAVLTFTVASDLCGPPIAFNKCGLGNTGWGGYNPCGDPLSRMASVTLALECVQSDSTCHGNNGNIELLRAMTPFGTDAEPPDGSGIVPPRVWTHDITPLASLLEGRQYIAVLIDTAIPPGWVVDVELHLSEDPAEASPTPPAEGIIPVHFTDSDPLCPTVPVTIPAEAQQVHGRLFVSGHDDGEFTQRVAQLRSGPNTIWQDQVWRTDCSPLGQNNCDPASCEQWNACGCPSCTFPRAGWCPGFVACHDDEPCNQDLDLTFWLPAGFTWNLQFEVLFASGRWPSSLVLYWY